MKNNLLFFRVKHLIFANVFHMSFEFVFFFRHRIEYFFLPIFGLETILLQHTTFTGILNGKKGILSSHRHSKVGAGAGSMLSTFVNFCSLLTSRRKSCNRKWESDLRFDTNEKKEEKKQNRALWHQNCRN